MLFVYEDERFKHRPQPQIVGAYDALVAHHGDQYVEFDVGIFGRVFYDTRYLKCFFLAFVFQGDEFANKVGVVEIFLRGRSGEDDRIGMCSAVFGFPLISGKVNTAKKFESAARILLSSKERTCVVMFVSHQTVSGRIKTCDFFCFR